MCTKTGEEAVFRHDRSESKGELDSARLAGRGGRPRRLQQSFARRNGPSGSPDGTLLGRAMDPTGVPVKVRLYKTTRDPRCTLVFGFLVSQSLCACTWPGSVPPAPPRLWAAAAPHLWSEASGPTRRRPWVRGSRGEYSSSALGPLQRLERNSRRDPLGGLSPSVRLLCASTVAGESQGSGWGVS